MNPFGPEKLSACLFKIQDSLYNTTRHHQKVLFRALPTSPLPGLSSRPTQGRF